MSTQLRKIDRLSYLSVSRRFAQIETRICADMSEIFSALISEINLRKSARTHLKRNLKIFSLPEKDDNQEYDHQDAVDP